MTSLDRKWSKSDFVNANWMLLLRFWGKKYFLCNAYCCWMFRLSEVTLKALRSTSRSQLRFVQKTHWTGIDHFWLKNYFRSNLNIFAPWNLLVWCFRLIPKLADCFLEPVFQKSQSLPDDRKWEYLPPLWPSKVKWLKSANCFIPLLLRLYLSNNICLSWSAVMWELRILLFKSITCVNIGRDKDFLNNQFWSPIGCPHTRNNLSF